MKIYITHVKNRDSVGRSALSPRPVGPCCSLHACACTVGENWVPENQTSRTFERWVGSTRMAIGMAELSYMNVSSESRSNVLFMENI